MIKPHHDNAGRRGRRRSRGGGSNGERRHQSIPLTADAVPAAVPDAPKPSPVVFVSDDALAKHPWLPPRVIVGSIWTGPHHVRVRIDESGNAIPWR